MALTNIHDYLFIAQFYAIDTVYFILFSQMAQMSHFNKVDFRNILQQFP